MYASVLQLIICKNQSKRVYNSAHATICIFLSEGSSSQTVKSFKGTMSKMNIPVALYNFRRNFYGDMEVVTLSSCSLASGTEICVMIPQRNCFFFFFRVNQQRPELLRFALGFDRKN